MTAFDPDCVKTRKLSEDSASGTNFYAPPSLYWPKTAENQLKCINRDPAVRVSHGLDPERTSGVGLLLLGFFGWGKVALLCTYRRSAPSPSFTLRLLHREQTSRSRHSRTEVSGPFCRAISAASGSTRRPHALHHRMGRTRAAAAFPSVIRHAGLPFHEANVALSAALYELILTARYTSVSIPRCF
jgi:hypothetical protein